MSTVALARIDVPHASAEGFRIAFPPRPRGRLLREPKSPYFIEEETIPRARAYVERCWQRTRWLQGRTLI